MGAQWRNPVGFQRIPQQLSFPAGEVRGRQVYALGNIVLEAAHYRLRHESSTALLALVCQPIVGPSFLG